MAGAARLSAIEEEGSPTPLGPAGRTLRAVDALCAAVDSIALPALVPGSASSLALLQPLLEAAHTEVTRLRAMSSELQERAPLHELFPARPQSWPCTCHRSVR
jgi:hypothetical protein